MEPDELTASEAAQMIRTKQIGSVELVEALLERIHASNAEIQAWETLLAEEALAAAAKADRVLARRRSDQIGVLHGVPFGVKDVIDTTGVRTACGFPPFDDRVPKRDGAVVARLKKSGAILLGKTVTTQFAWAQPSRTRNPWNLERTPGGSSSGSAAAVAARQVPLALGTQTAGSTLRPAAYNGVVGFKPTLGRISTRGVFPLARTLDHVGCIARSVEDCRLFLRATSTVSPSVDQEQGGREGAPVLGLLREAVDRSSPDVVANLDAALAAFTASGAEIREVITGVSLADAIAAHRITINYEAARLHRPLMRRYPGPNTYAPKTLEYIAAGSRISHADYVGAQETRQRFTAALDVCLGSVDAIVLPTVVDVAPSLETTGDPSLQTPFTFAGVPAYSLPCGVSSAELPIGLQLVGRRGRDEELATIAEWCEALLPRCRAPTC